MVMVKKDFNWGAATVAFGITFWAARMEPEKAVRAVAMGAVVAGVVGVVSSDL